METTKVKNPTAKLSRIIGLCAIGLSTLVVLGIYIIDGGRMSEDAMVGMSFLWVPGVFFGIGCLALSSKGVVAGLILGVVMGIASYWGLLTFYRDIWPSL
jgi:hypothetical protein